MIVDANVLLYAVDDRSQFHTTALTWLSRAMNGVERVGFPWVSLTAFQRIITHPRITENPLTPEGYSECVPGHFRVIGVDVLLKFRFSVVMVG